MGEGNVEVRSEKIDKFGSEHFYNIGVDGVGIIFIGTERLDSILDQLLRNDDTVTVFFKKTSNHTFILRVVGGNILIIIDVVGKLVRSFHKMLSVDSRGSHNSSARTRPHEFVRMNSSAFFVRTNSSERISSELIVGRRSRLDSRVRLRSSLQP